MTHALYWNTVDPLLTVCLRKLMKAEEFASFRLVGGTALSLQLGHRISVDIDLFTDAVYGSIDFDFIDNYLRNSFKYVDTSDNNVIGMGKPYFVGNSSEDSIKLDLFYTDPFIRPIVEIEEIRMASIEDIIGMKVQVIANGGRKKDFWDLHELMNDFSINTMIALHAERYPYEHNEKEIIARFTNFSQADDDFEPRCQRGKHWEMIKLDFADAMKPMQVL